MDKRSVPLAIVSCILALAGLAAYFAYPAAPPEAVPARLLMENSGGRVVFTHKAHASPGGAYGANACAACHHELVVAPGDSQPEDTKVMLCTACHGSADDPGFIASHQEQYKAEGDKRCITCHHARVTGYSDAWNHEDHKTYAGDDCQACHHETRYEYKAGRFMTIKPQKCSNCHTARPNPLASTILKDAAHAKCQDCHDDLFALGAKGCAACHGVKKAAQDLADGSLDTNYTACSSCHKPIAGPMDAYHGNCMSCHDKNGKGPGKGAPCAQCHTP